MGKRDAHSTGGFVLPEEKGHRVAQIDVYNAGSEPNFRLTSVNHSNLIVFWVHSSEESGTG